MSLRELGPKGRPVEDPGFGLRAMGGPDHRAPASIAEPGALFNRPLKRSFKKTRIAWSRDLGGLPMDARVTAVLESQKGTFKQLGCVVEDAEPDLSAATQAFHTLRALGFLDRLPLLRKHRDKLKHTVIWNIEQGLKLTGEQIARGNELRTQVFHRMRTFLEKYDFLLCPVNQVVPFSVDQPYPTEIAGVKLDNYIDWMKSCYYITTTSHPAISVPAGFSPQGRPGGPEIRLG